MIMHQTARVLHLLKSYTPLTPAKHVKSGLTEWKSETGNWETEFSFPQVSSSQTSVWSRPTSVLSMQFYEENNLDHINKRALKPV